MRRALLEISEIGERELARWRELANAAVESNPFFEPEFVLATAAALDANPMLLIATSGSEWVGAMPAQYLRGWRHLPIKTLATWRHLYSFFGAPLIRVGDEHAVLKAWLKPGDDRVPAIHGLDLLDADGQIHRALDAVTQDMGATTVVFEKHHRAALQRDAGGLSLKTGGKRRRENARLERRLSETLGDDVETVDRATDPAAVDEFLRLEVSGWKGAQGTALASNPAHAEFFRSMCDGFRRQGRLQLLSLEGGRRTAAMKCNLVAGDTIFCFKTAFDESLGEFSPGVQLERGFVDYVDDDARIALIDTCAERDNKMANTVWPNRRQIVSLAVPPPGPRGAPSRLLVRGLAKTQMTVRRTP